MRIVADIPNDPDALARSLEGKIEESIAQWRAHPEWKSLYETNIRYQRQPPPEKYQSSEETRKRGVGDCDHFTVDRVAELRQRHGEYGAQPYVYQTGPTTWHAIVRRGDGTLEDPSRIQKVRERRGWPDMGINGIEDDEDPPETTVDIVDAPDGRKIGVVRLKTKDARITIELAGDGTTHSLQRAVAIAGRILADPKVRAILPPQAVVALQAAGKLVRLAKSGKLEDIAHRLKGPVGGLARRLLG